jgi:hypothetical protein
VDSGQDEDSRGKRDWVGEGELNMFFRIAV